MGLERWLVTASLGIGFAYAGFAGCSSEESAEPLCVPGTTITCLGAGQCDGVQTCNAEGSGYGACDCGTTTTSTSSTSSLSSTGSGGSAGSGGSGGEGGSGVGGAAGAGGSGGGPPASCEPEGGDDECVTCMKEDCCTAYGACFGSTDCACYVTCQNTSPGSCLFDCGLTATPTAAVAIVQCTHQLCSLACASD